MSQPGSHPHPVVDLGRRPATCLLFAALLAIAGTAQALPNLVVSSIDLTEVENDCTTGAVGGQARVRIANIGSREAISDVSVEVFEDRNGDGEWSLATDALLGVASASAPLPAPDGTGGHVTEVFVPLGGSLIFAERPVHARVDATDSVTELDESDNVLKSCLTVDPNPSAILDPFDMHVAWQALAGTPLQSSPVVAQLSDDNDDGRIDGDDVPDVVVPSVLGTWSGLAVVSGDDGRVQFLTDPAWQVRSQPAVGDIDGDGFPELVSVHADGDKVLAFNHDGSTRWVSTQRLLHGTDPGATAPIIADLDGNGLVEVIVGRTVYDGLTGLLLADGRDVPGNGPRGAVPDNAAYYVSVGDVDNDGLQEIVAGLAVYEFDDGVLVREPAPPGGSWQYKDGWTALANLDDDPEAEIILTNNSQVSVWDHDGTRMDSWWYGNENCSLSMDRGDVFSPNWRTGGRPVVADFDGDGVVDFGVQGRLYFHAFNRDGSTLWSASREDASTWTGSTAFDFNGDGAHEVVGYGDDRLYIIDGSTAVSCDPLDPSCQARPWFTGVPASYWVPHGVGTSSDMPVVADVDGDGHAEIVTTANKVSGGADPADVLGLFVYEHVHDDWRPARKTWNQDTYHVLNVEDNGSIPRHPKTPWLHPAEQPLHVWRAQVGPGLTGADAAPDLTASRLRHDPASCPSAATVTVRVGNAGCEVAPIVEVAFHVADPILGGAALTSAFTTTPLGPGEWEDVTATITGYSPPGRVWAVADSDLNQVGSVDEADESNNTCRSAFTDACSETGFLPVEIQVGASSAPEADRFDPVLLSASVTETTTGAPVGGVFVDLELGVGGPACRALSGAAGLAACRVTAPGGSASLTVTATIAPPERYSAPFPVHSIPQTLDREDMALVPASEPIQPYREPATLDARVLARHDGALDRPGVEVHFEDGVPAAGADAISDATGLAVIQLSDPSYVPGSHVLRASTPSDEAFDATPLDQTIHVLAPQLVLSPLTEIVSPNEGVTMTARLLDDGGQLDGYTVVFEIASDPAPAPAYTTTCITVGCETGLDGRAVWSYQPDSAYVGTETITAYLDLNGNGSGPDANEPSASAEIHRVDVRPTTLTWSGAASADTRDEAHLAATLTDTELGTPIAGQAVRFALDALTCRGVTDANGLAECWLTPGAPSGSRTATATYAGAVDKEVPQISPTAVSFQVDKEETSLRMVSAAVQNVGFVALAARLRKDGALSLENQPIQFFDALGNPLDGPENTDADGIAIKLTYIPAPGLYTFSADFAGDDEFSQADSNDGLVQVVLSGGSSEIETNPAYFPPDPATVTTTANGDGSVLVEWTHSDGSLPATGFRIEDVADPNRVFTAQAGEFSRVVPSLTNGSAYTFQVIAVNELGESAPASGTAQTPHAVPSAPIIDWTESEIGNGQIKLCWDPPLDWGGDQTDTYHPTRMPVGAAPSIADDCATWTDVTNGIPYDVRVRASNVAGHGVESEPGSALVPAGPPAAPENVLAVAGLAAGQISVAWDRPSDVGGSEVIGYSIEDGAGTVLATAAGHERRVQLSGLAAGVDQNVVVRAQNGTAEWSGPSTPTATAMPFGPPDAPGPPLLTADNAAILLQWTPPSEDNGAAVSGYTAETTLLPPDSLSSAAPTTSEWITGLVNGDVYAADAWSHNRAGRSGSPGASQAPAMPRREPEAPPAPSADADSYPQGGTAQICFDAVQPPNDGGSTVLDYAVRAFPGGRETTVAHDPLAATYCELFTGLANGVEYDFTVTARTDAGVGEESDFSPRVTPYGPPSCPREQVAELAGDGALRVRWRFVGDDGGAPISQYHVDCLECPGDPNPPSPIGHVPAVGATYTGLTPGDTYTFSVTAENEATRVTTDDCSFTAVAATFPLEPDSVAVQVADGAATVTWGAPLDTAEQDGDGYADISHYVVRTIPEVSAPVTVQADGVYSAYFNGLFNGTEYEFRVTAVNGVGPGPHASVVATPCTVPYPPLNVAVAPTDDAELTLSWSAPGWNGGCEVSSYTIDHDTGVGSDPLVVDGSTFSATFPGLTAGTSYQFQIAADNDAGASPLVTVTATAATCPGPPTNVVAIGGDSLARVCWEAPAFDGHAPVSDYRIRALPGGLPTGALEMDVGGAQTCVVFTGLTNGQLHRFEVEATNGACHGAASADLVDDPCLLDVGDECTPVGWSCPDACTDPGEENRDTHEVDECTPGLPIPIQVAFEPASIHPSQTTVATVELDHLTGVDGADLGLTVDPASGTVALLEPVQGPDASHATDWIAVPPVSSTVSFVVGGLATGNATITASLNSGTANGTLPVTNPDCMAGDQVYASINSPAEAADVWDHDTFVNVTADSSCDPIQGWTLETRLVDDCEDCWHALDLLPGVDPTAPVQSDDVARFDPTLRLNGLHEIKLTVTPAVGDDVEIIRTVLVRGNQKIGHFTTSFVDLTIPVGELPIQVIRTYDSRDPRVGPFGRGWSLSLTDVRLEMNRDTGADWEEWNNQDNGNWQQWPQNCMVETEPHVVSLTFPDGTVHRFRPIFELTPGAGNACQIAGVTSGYVRYEPVYPTRGQLEAIDLDFSTNVVYRGEGGATGALLWGSASGPVYDPRDFRYTRQDGMEYEFYDLELKRIWMPEVPDSDPSAGRVRLEITSNRIEAHPGGTSVRIDPSISGSLVTRLWANGEMMTYGYSGDRLLWSQTRVQKAENLGTTSYAYSTEPGQEDLLSSITDALDRPVSVSCYSTDNRLTHVCSVELGETIDCASPTSGRCVELVHDLPGDAERITDRRGYLTTLEYDTHGNVLKRTLPTDDGSGEEWTYTYADDDQLETELNPEGELTRYHYDPDTGLRSAVESAADAQDGGKETTTFTYDERTNPLTIESEMGAVWSFAHDEGGYPLSVTDSAGVSTHYETDDLGNVRLVTDAQGNATEYRYSPDQFLRWERNADGLCTLQGFLDGNEQIWQDARGNPRGITRGVSLRAECLLYDLDPAHPVTVKRFEYDADDRPIRTIYPDGSVMGTEYDAVGRKVADILPYKPTGNVDEYEIPAGDLVTHAELPRTIYGYDLLGQLESIRRPDTPAGEVVMETFGYDASGNREEHVDAAGRRTCYRADAQNRPWKTWLPFYDPNEPAEIDTRSCATIMVSELPSSEVLYDGAGRLVTRRVLVDRAAGDPGGYVEWTYEYDAAGRRTFTHQPPINGSTDATETVYDDDGRVLQVINPDDTYTEFAYDDAGRKQFEYYRSSSGVVQAYKEWEHDDLGRVTKEFDENSNATGFAYDQLGRLTSVTDAEGRVTIYGYDKFGRLARQRDARENVTLYEHDVMGRRSAKQLPLGQREVSTYTISGQLEKHWTFGADPLAPADAITYSYESDTDRLLSVAHPDGLEIRRTHEADGSVLSLVRDEPGAGPDPTLTYRHDSRGRPWRVDQPDGSVVESLYDETGFRTRVTVWNDEPPPLGSGTQLHRLDFVPDVRGRLSRVTEVDGDPMTDDSTVRYTYDSRGRIDFIEYFASTALGTPELVVTYTWDDDPRPRLTRMHWVDAGATTLADIRYELDDAGHRTDLTHTGAIGQRTIHHDFDATYRLGMETHRDGATPGMGANLFQIEYRYDAVGNRTRRIDRSGTPWSVDSDTISTHDDNDRLTSAGVSTYTWDARGRLTGESDGLETLVHSWSGDDRLLSVTGGAVDVTYSYNGEQRLIGRQQGAEPAVRFIVDSGFLHAQALVEYTGTLGAGATIDARHVFGQRLLGERRAELQWAVTDALGSVRGLYDADAAVPFSGPWGYEAYGPHLSGAPGAALTHRFAGERRDAATGLDYLRARWMRPSWGALPARDPLEGSSRRPLERQAYAYGALEPTLMVDPTGRRATIHELNVTLLLGGILSGLNAGLVSHAEEHGELGFDLAAADQGAVDGVVWTMAFAMGGQAAGTVVGRLFPGLGPRAAAAYAWISDMLARARAALSRGGTGRYFGGQIDDIACVQCSVRIAEDLGLPTGNMALSEARAAGRPGMVEVMEWPVGSPPGATSHYAVLLRSGNIADRTILTNIANQNRGVLPRFLERLRHMDTFTPQQHSILVEILRGVQLAR